MDCVARTAARYPKPSHDLRKLRTMQTCEIRILDLRLVAVGVEVDGLVS